MTIYHPDTFQNGSALVVSLFTSRYNSSCVSLICWKFDCNLTWVSSSETIFRENVWAEVRLWQEVSSARDTTTTWIRPDDPVCLTAYLSLPVCGVKCRISQGFSVYSLFDFLHILLKQPVHTVWFPWRLIPSDIPWGRHQVFWIISESVSQMVSGGWGIKIFSSDDHCHCQWGWRAVYDEEHVCSSYYRQTTWRYVS